MQAPVMMDAHAWLDSGSVLEQLISPLMVLPVQLEDSGAKHGETRLMVAVLEEALRTFRRHAASTSRHGDQLFREVEQWIESTDNSCIYAFESICHVVGLDADRLRAGLRNWRVSSKGGAKVYRFRRVNARRTSVVAPRVTTAKVTLRIAEKRAS
jgi:hypothetical protein